MDDPLTIYLLCETFTGYRDFFMRKAPAPHGFPPLYHTWDDYVRRGHRVHIFSQDYMYDEYNDFEQDGKWIHTIPQPGRYLRRKRLTTLGNSLRRAWKSRIHVCAAPIISVGWNVAKAAGAKQHVVRVREGLVRLHERLAALGMMSDAQHDLEIMRQTPMVEHHCAELAGDWEQWAVLFSDAHHPLERDVDALVGQLEERCKCLAASVDRIEQDKRRLIEET